jgi:hypothetical protein
MTTKRTKAAAIITVAIATTLGTACWRGTDLEVRTFPLAYLTQGEAAGLIEPYVYGDRADRPGTYSMTEGSLTVRETRDNLERISRVLAEYDVPRPDTRLHFQLIEADGFTSSDERISDVVTELGKIFQFRGYRLAGETMLSATDGSEVRQRLRTEDGALYEITGQVFEIGSGTIRLEEVRLYSETGTSMQTTVNIRPGQTLVLGSSPKEGSTATLLLTVRAEEVSGPA